MAAKSNRALILVDVVTPLLAGPAPPPGVAEMIRFVQGELRYFRERDRVVVFSIAAALAGPGAAAIVPELTPRTHEAVLVRPGPSAFSTGGLLERLREAAVKRVTLVGVGTAGPIAVSAVDAFSAGFGVTVPDPCVCDFHVGDHKAALRLIRDVWRPLFRGEEAEEVTAPGVAPPPRA